MVEKLFNQGVGRPSMISERNIQAPLPPIVPNIEYGLWEDNETAPEKGCLISYCISTFRYTCEMLRMTAGPLDEIYAINGNMSLPEKENLIAQTNLRLSAFYDKLPSFLRLTQSSAKNPLPPHIYLFHLHYHTAIILLHRPLISRSQHLSPLHSLLKTSDSSHIEACTTSAERITSIFGKYRNFYSLRKISISVVDCARTAAVIHLYNMTSNDELTKDKSRRLLLPTVQYLREMSVAWGWSQRAVVAVKHIAEKWLKEDSTNMLGLQETNAETEGQMQSSTVFSAGDPSRQAPASEGNVEPEMAFLDSLNWDDILQPDSNWHSILQDDPNSVQSMLDIWQSEFLFE